MTIARAQLLVCRTATVSPERTASAELALGNLRREFPTVVVSLDYAARGIDPLATLDLARWNDRRVPFAEFDDHVEALARRGPCTLVLRGEAREVVRAAHEMLTRWQRWIDRRNAASRLPELDALLARLGRLHDLDKPLVRADYDHALDTWQWVLRLAPQAGLDVQMAALLHDIERLESEADARVEHQAPDYARFKDAHARRGAEIAADLVGACGGSDALRDRVADLVAHHESASDGAAAVLRDADALSFFSLNSSGYLRYFGPEQTRKKIAYTLGRLRRSERPRLHTIRLCADVAKLLDEVVTAELGRRPAAVVEAHA